MKSIGNANALDSLKVHIAQGETKFEITDMITNISILESLHTDLNGHIELNDNAGLIDNFILTGDEMVIFEMGYFNIDIKFNFFLDGISDINITDKTHIKSYVIRLASVNDYISANNLVSKSYNGSGTAIIMNIFDSYFGAHGSLLVNVASIKHGRYIAPTISPKIAINTILNKLYDINGTGFFMYQPLFPGENFTMIDSFYEITNRPSMYTLSPTNIFADDIQKEGPLKHEIGRPGNIVIEDTKSNIINAADGTRGMKIEHLLLDTSDFKNEIFAGANGGGAVNKIVPYRDNMYQDAENLTSGKDSYKIAAKNFLNSTSGAIKATAYRTPAIPGLSVGHKVTLKIGETKIERSNTGASESYKYSGDYIVTKIDHNINNGLYVQNITLRRGIL
jgi:hypothetical protein